MRFTGNGITNCYPDQVEDFISITVLTDAACKSVIERVGSDGELKPRALMQAFDAVLGAAEPLLQTGELQVIEPGFAQDVLQDYQVVSPEEPQ